MEIPGQELARQYGVWDLAVNGCLGCAGLSVMLFGVWLFSAVVSVVIATVAGSQEPLIVGLAWGSTVGVALGIVLVSAGWALFAMVTDGRGASE